MKTRVLFKISLLLQIGLGVVCGYSLAAEPVMSDYEAYPIFTVNPVKPNILIMLDNSGSMNYNAYGNPEDNGGNVSGEPYAGAPYPAILPYRVSLSADDSEEAGGNNSVNNGSPDLDLGRFTASGNETTIGTRFQGVEIPPGAKISNAYIEFTVQAHPSSAEGAKIALEIRGDASSNAAVFKNGEQNIGDRDLTEASVIWNDPAVADGDWIVNDIKRTPDISSIIQEIVNLSKWRRGNAIALTIKYDDSPGVQNSKRSVWSYDGSNSRAPVLHIEYSSAQYYGYFNPEWFYTFSSNKYYHAFKKRSYDEDEACWNVIYPDDLAAPPADETDWNSTCLDNGEIVAKELWDGNWMNWASMRRIDVARKVIMGGKATSRTGGGNQTNIGEDPAQGRMYYNRTFDSSPGSAVTPYSDGSNTEIYGFDDGYLYVNTDIGGTYPYDDKSFILKVDKFEAYDGRDFGEDGNLAGVMQKYWEKAWWGNEFFYNDGTGAKEEGGKIVSSIGTDMTSIITDLQNTSADTWTPLAEAYYVAMQYIKQEDPDTDLGYHGSAIGAINDTNDPYYQNKEFVECAPTFVILLTDGASTKDGQIPDYLKDYDGDGDNTACYEYSNSNCDYGSGGTDYLDDVALYARTNDLRADLDGEQNMILYTVYAFGDDGNARSLLRDAARNGGFEDDNGNGKPDGNYGDSFDLTAEWDTNRDGDPDTYFEAQDGYKLESALGGAINDILKRASSGTAVSVLATSSEGEGNLAQAYFRPEVETAGNNVKWAGYLQSLWVDSQSNLREDTNGNHALEVNEDKIIRYEVDAQGNTVVRKYAVGEIECSSTQSDLTDSEACSTAPGDEIGYFNERKCVCEEINYPEIEIECSSTDIAISDEVACAGVDGLSNGSFNSGDCICDDGAIEKTTMDDVAAIWEAGEQLAKMNPGEDSSSGDRKLFTTLDGKGAGGFHGGIEFSITNGAAIQPYLGIKDTEAWSYLAEYNATITQSDRTDNLIRFIRGDNDGFSGVTSIRSREMEVEGVNRVWRLGDIVHSTPVTVARPMDNYGLIYTDESYDQYYRHYKDRESVVYVGANDGILHAFTSWQYDEDNKEFSRPSAASGTEEIGKELWGYIPRALLPHLKWLPSEDYTHVYFVDLKPKVVDAKIFTAGDGTHINGWGTVLIGGMRMGGKSINVTDDFDYDSSTDDTLKTFSSSFFAIDITNPREPKLLWEKSYDGLNLTTVRPNVVKVGEKWFLTLGSGPDSFTGGSSTTAKIYVADLLTGALYNDGSNDWLFELSEHDQAFMGGIASLDYRLNYNVDSVYMSHTYDINTNSKKEPDWKGSIYRIKVPYSCEKSACSGYPYGTIGNFDTDSDGQEDCSCSYDSDPTTWSIGKMFAADRPITAEPSLSTDTFKNIWVYFGTGRYLSNADKSTDEDNFLAGIKDPFFNRSHQTPDTSGYDYGVNATNRPYYLENSKNLTLIPSDLFNSDDFEVIFPWGYYEAPQGDCAVPSGAVGDIYEDGSCIAYYTWAPEDDPPPDWICVEKTAGGCDGVLEGVIAETGEYKSLYWKKVSDYTGACDDVELGAIVTTDDCVTSAVTPVDWTVIERPAGDCTGVEPPAEGDINDDGGSCYAGYWACGETVEGGCDTVDFTQNNLTWADPASAGDINGDGSCMCQFVADPVARVLSTTSTAAMTFNEVIAASRVKEGWRRSLYDPKERSVQKPTVFGGLSLFSSYVPSDEVCSFGGNSYLYALYYETGTAFKREVFENGTTYEKLSGTLYARDRIDLGLGMASTPTIHVGRQRDNKAEVLINKSTGEIRGIEIDPAFKIRPGLRYWKD